jgi:hypothetical protein
VPEGETSTQAPVRAGRCANHPDVPRVADCSVCRRPLCLSCAIPVRGRVVGPECVRTLVHDAPSTPSAVVTTGRGDLAALIGFGLALAVSVLPWSRFGDSSRVLGAWSLHWSLLAVGSALAGLVLAVLARRRPLEPVGVALGYVLLGLLVVIGAIWQHHHPPLLSESTYWPWVAALGGIAGVAGGFRRAAALGRAARMR